MGGGQKILKAPQTLKTTPKRQKTPKKTAQVATPYS